MRDVHLSDEAVAAFADDVLTGGARERARRHTAACIECHHAVLVQREAVWALRAAPAPALPTSLLDRLRDVPVTTPVHRPPVATDERGTPMFAAFGTAAAFAPSRPSAASATRPPRTHHRGRNFVIAAASLAVIGSLAGTAAADTGSDDPGASPAAQPVPSVTGPLQVSPDAQLARAFTPLQP